jgi:hypothetical protein
MSVPHYMLVASKAPGSGTYNNRKHVVDFCLTKHIYRELRINTFDFKSQTMFVLDFLYHAHAFLICLEHKGKHKTYKTSNHTNLRMQTHIIYTYMYRHTYIYFFVKYKIKEDTYNVLFRFWSE